MSPEFRPEQFIGLFVYLVLAGIALCVHIVVCFFLYKFYQRVPQQFRKMEPGMVWLLLIPCFNLVWNFFVYIRLSRSLKGYFNSVGNQTVGDCGEGLGLAFSICEAATIIPCLGLLAGIGAIVLVILYLVKANQLTEQIPQTT
jgi:heme/copper-type cytochrome/quinol oxidase subunit 2